MDEKSILFGIVGMLIYITIYLTCKINKLEIIVEDLQLLMVTILDPDIKKEIKKIDIK